MARPPARRPDWRTRFVTDIPAAVALFDLELRYLAASPAWIEAFDLSRVALVGRRHDELRKGDGDALAEVQRRALLGEAVENYQVGDVERGGQFWGTILSARPHRNNDGTIAGVLVALQQTRAFGGERASQLVPDLLTGLADRHGFTRRLREVLAETAAQRRSVVVLLINLDRFRAVNNLHGVRIGDQVLRITAQRLLFGTRSQRPGEGHAAGESRARDLVARLGADEFAIMLGAPAPKLADVATLTDRFLDIVQSPITIDDLRIRVTASIGFVVTGPAQRDEDDVLRDLDLALREAKSRAPSRVVAWEPSLTRTATRRYSIADQLQRALDNGEFVLHYQPIIQLADDRMVGVEALLRWNHPSDGLVPPNAFVPLLEESGLIVPVGSWVVREAIRQVESWCLLYGRDIVEWISVNASARQFNDPAPLLAMLSEAYESGFPLRRLTIEITETSLMRNPETTRSVLAELHNLGIRIAIDDFGTGYSSLDAFQHYRADAIKIDAGFISRIGSAEGEKLAGALLGIARMYGATVIAEGVETAAQRDFLSANGCQFGQGYLFARPMDAAALGVYALNYAARGAQAEEPSPETPPAPRHSAGDGSA
ncbi:MAG TPA: EAL domain-containing protein [Stellaceae bacterium]|nr:EAL domain-containing protein [Stellaceae bacterium]